MKKFGLYILFSFLLITSKIEGFSKTILTFPYKNTVVIDKSISIKWLKNNLCAVYNIEIAKDSAFDNKILAIQTSSESYAYVFPEARKFYLRIKPTCMSEWTTASVDVIDLNFEKNNIENWFSADSNITITSGRISRWGDMLKNNTEYAENPNVNNRPILLAAEPIMNNKPMVFFKPSTILSYLDLNKKKSLMDATVLLLYRVYLNNSNAQHILGGISGNGYYAQNIASGTGFGMFATANDGSVQHIYSDISAIAPVYRAHAATKKHLYVNGYQIESGGILIDSIKYSRLGCRENNTSLNFKGEVAEILIFNKELSDKEIGTWNNYLFMKYAPPVILGGDTIVGNSFSDMLLLDASNRFVKYLWTTGDTISKINVKTSGTYGVWATDVFGHTSYSEKKVYPYARLNNDTVYICEGGNFTLDLKINSSLFSVKWLDNNSNSKIRTFNQPGRYFVEIKDQSGKTVLDTLNVLIENFSFNKDFIGNTVNVCNGDELELKSNTGLSSVLWSNGFSSYKYPISANEQISVIAQSLIGCSYSNNININVLGQNPIADFEIGSIHCEQQEIKFTDKSTLTGSSNISQWQWQLGENKNSNEQNPIISYNSKGLKSITLKVITNVGCSAEIKKQMIVNQKPRVFFDNLLACQNKPIQFRDLSTPNADSMAAWQWNFNQLGSSIQKNPLFTFPDNRIYSVHLKAINNKGCYDTITRILGVNPSPVSNFISDTIGCVGTPFTFINNSTITYPVSISKFSWDFGDGNQESILNTITHQYNSSGTYSVSLITQATNQCVDTIKKQINIYINPVVNFEISDNHCVGQPILFYDATKTIDSAILLKWNWSFGGVGISGVKNPIFTFKNQGNYAVQLTAETNKGCKSTKTKSVTVTNNPTVDFSFNPTFGPSPLNVSFNNLSPGGTQFVWNFGDESPVSSETNPMHIYKDNGSYFITLWASNSLGCTNSISKNILVDSPKFDANLLDINLIKNENNFTVLAGIENKGNMPIQNMIITAKLENGMLIRESWNGNLFPGQVLNYSFSNKLIYDESKDIPVVCVHIESVNANNEEITLDNNILCKAIKIGKLNLLMAYPNPTKDIVKIGMMFPFEMNYTLIIYNDLAQFISSKNLISKAGYNLIDVDLSNLNSAIYTVEIRTEDEIFRKRILKQ